MTVFDKLNEEQLTKLYKGEFLEWKMVLSEVLSAFESDHFSIQLPKSLYNTIATRQISLGSLLTPLTMLSALFINCAFRPHSHGESILLLTVKKKYSFKLYEFNIPKNPKKYQI